MTAQQWIEQLHAAPKIFNIHGTDFVDASFGKTRVALFGLAEQQNLHES